MTKRLRIAPGTRVERRADYRKRLRGTGTRARLGTVTAIGSDVFSKAYALVNWDDDGQQYCNNSDLRIAR